jgi:hypothetical protein
MMFTYQSRDIPSLFPAAITYITTKVISVSKANAKRQWEEITMNATNPASCSAWTSKQLVVAHGPRSRVRFGNASEKTKKHIENAVSGESSK